MPDLSTNYMGMNLRTPLVPSASPLSEEVDDIKRMEDAGAAAVVLYSLFEEQLAVEQLTLHNQVMLHTNSFHEAQSFFPELSSYRLGPEEYLEHIHKAKDAVSIPIIASLNGTTPGGWVEYATQIEQAGADALELNVYYVPSDLDLTSQEVEQNYLDILGAVKEAIQIPVAMKLGPFFSNLAHIAWRLDVMGVDALVLFNRFYQPDVDLEGLEVRPRLLLSTPQSLRLPLRWIAMLHGRIRADVAASGGIHTGRDALKMLMAGASVTMLCSSLLRRGIAHISTVEREMVQWMEEHDYESVLELRGSMSQRNSSDPASFERAQYIKALQSY